jgi:hypothetical protein
MFQPLSANDLGVVEGGSSKEVGRPVMRASTFSAGRRPLSDHRVLGMKKSRSNECPSGGSMGRVAA